MDRAVPEMSARRLKQPPGFLFNEIATNPSGSRNDKSKKEMREMTAESLAVICGAVLSLVFSYTPGLSGKWDVLMPEIKRLVMLVLLVAVAAAVFGLACSGWGADFGISVACDRAGFVGLLQALIYAVMANQTAYMITKKN